MTIEQLLFSLGGISLGVISYFLKQSLNDLKEVKKESVELSKKIAVIESDYINKHNNLNEKFDNLYDAMKDLTKEIKDLTKELNDKKKP